MANQKRRTHKGRPKQPRSDNRPRGAGMRQKNLLRAAVIAVLLFCLGSLIKVFYPSAPDEVVSNNDRTISRAKNDTVVEQPASKLSVFWQESYPDRIGRDLKPTSAAASNVHPNDYVGPDACKECHQKNYRDWSDHPHRKMNAFADEASVVGDFSGSVPMHYKGGTATFFRQNGEYRMRYERGEFVRAYKINQTIGSRFFQYYVGRGLEGPEPPDHDYYQHDHVLPFGYWIERKAWVPIVHVLEELADDQRWDPLFSLVGPKEESVGGSPHALAPGKARGATTHFEDHLTLNYATACNYCHTTFPLGDMFVRMKNTKSDHLPVPMFFSLSRYLADSHPDLWDGARPSHTVSRPELDQIFHTMVGYQAPRKAVTLGISCEACHLGCKAHSRQQEQAPSFIAQSPRLLTDPDHLPLDQGRTHANLNWICSRCHSGDRPTYAAGISTWNSTEFTDATRGACYSQLTCVHCHDPHKATGPAWTKSADEDDASCLSCHNAYSNPVTRRAHTHHKSGSSGDRCMNCHMPKIDEGMQDVVRTHTIFSPTQEDMIEANHPNACNLGHLDKPIDWTLDYLQSWYGKRYAEDKLATNYPNRDSQVGLGWLKHPDAAVRLVGADALARDESDWALPDLIDGLNDDFLLNRQFIQMGLEDKFGIKLDERFGYWFYMTKQERQQPIRRIREALLNNR